MGRLSIGTRPTPYDAYSGHLRRLLVNDDAVASWLTDSLQNGDPAASGTRPQAGLSGGGILWVQTFADVENGRLSLYLPLVAGVILRRFFDGASNGEAFKRTKYGLRWKVALGQGSR